MRIGNDPRQSVPPEVTELCWHRHHARLAQDWPEADRVREMIRELGWTIRDKPDEYYLEKIINIKGINI